MCCSYERDRMPSHSLSIRLGAENQQKRKTGSTIVFGHKNVDKSVWTHTFLWPNTIWLVIIFFTSDEKFPPGAMRIWKRKVIVGSRLARVSAEILHFRNHISDARRTRARARAWAHRIHTTDVWCSVIFHMRRLLSAQKMLSRFDNDRTIHSCLPIETRAREGEGERKQNYYFDK